MKLLTALLALSLAVLPASADSLRLGLTASVVTGADRQIDDDTAVSLWLSRHIRGQELEFRFARIELDRGALQADSWSLGWRWTPVTTAPVRPSFLLGLSWNELDAGPAAFDALGGLVGVRLLYPVGRFGLYGELTGRYVDYGAGPVFSADVGLGLSFTVR